MPAGLFPGTLLEIWPSLCRVTLYEGYFKEKAVVFKSDELWESHKQIWNNVTELIRSSRKKILGKLH